MWVLIVEDEKKVVRALRERLEAEHYDVHVASTGEEGFFLVNHQSFESKEGRGALFRMVLPRTDAVIQRPE